MSHILNDEWLDVMREMNPTLSEKEIIDLMDETKPYVVYKDINEYITDKEFDKNIELSMDDNS